MLLPEDIDTKEDVDTELACINKLIGYGYLCKYNSFFRSREDIG